MKPTSKHSAEQFAPLAQVTSDAKRFLTCDICAALRQPKKRMSLLPGGAGVLWGLALPVLLATALGLGCERWSFRATGSSGATQWAASTIAEGLSLTGSEGWAASEWPSIPPVEPEQAKVPLAESRQPLPKRSSLASHVVDSGPVGGKAQEANPGLPLCHTADPDHGRFSRARPFPCASPRSWRVSAHGARGPPFHPPCV